MVRSALGARREELVLDAASLLASRGVPVTPRALAGELGWGDARSAREVCWRLESMGRWPPAPAPRHALGRVPRLDPAELRRRCDAVLAARGDRPPGVAPPSDPAADARDGRRLWREWRAMRRRTATAKT